MNPSQADIFFPFLKPFFYKKLGYPIGNRDLNLDFNSEIIMPDVALAL